MRDDGVINYHYDRIGNMLNQSSDIVHNDRGVSVTDLGDMDSGGSAGRFNRTGRAASDPPGPHALTSIRHSPLATRHYDYDANGNMLIIDGLTNTWDFKDRLIRVEDTNMVAHYTYDYTDRRVMKRVWSKTSTNLQPSAFSLQPSSVLYPDKYFEVREHDAPVKYVWNGNTRVARVTGSLNTNQRVQRLRLWPGWNLVSLAVSATNALGQISSAFSLQPSAFRWAPNTLSWLQVAPNDTLAAGTVLWLLANTNTTATVTGTYNPPVNATAPTGPSFQPGAGFEPLPLLGERAGVRADVPLWKFDGPSQTWLVRYGTNLPGQSDFPATLAAGEAFMARADSSTTLEVPESALRIRYYHQDHLGSSSVLTDAAGALVSETANYAFGFARNEFLPRSLWEPYQFTQKERDAESGLDYFEARFLAVRLGRFVRPDPLLGRNQRPWLAIPQFANAYAYCHNHPLILVDPTGEADEPKSIDYVPMEMSSEGIAFTTATGRDDFRAKPYNDNPNAAESKDAEDHKKTNCTIGYGDNIAPKMTCAEAVTAKIIKADLKVTETEARESLRKKMAAPVRAVNGLLEKMNKKGQTLNQNQFDSLVDMAYQSGVGAFQRSKVYGHLLKGEFDQAAVEMGLCNKEKNQPGTIKRYEERKERFLKKTESTPERSK